MHPLLLYVEDIGLSIGGFAGADHLCVRFGKVGSDCFSHAA
jgi:hypothetical protein